MKNAMRMTCMLSIVACLALSTIPLAAEESWESLNQESKRAKIND